MCGSPTYPSGEHDRALVSRRCRSAGAYAGTGLSAQGFTVPSRTIWYFAPCGRVSHCKERRAFFGMGNHIVGDRILLR
jgi:hypothetical protein